MVRTARPIRLAALAEFLGCAFEGEGDREVGGFGSLGSASADELSFVRDARHRAALEASTAGVVLAPPALDVGGRAALRSPRPDADFARLIERFAPRLQPPAGVSPRALVDPEAIVDASASVAPGAFVGPACRVGARTVIGPNATLVRDVEVGEDGWIHAGCVLEEGTRVGARVVLQPGVVLGGAGFGLVPGESGAPRAMPHRGRVVIEDDVEIGSNTTVDRATLDETRIRRGAKIDNLVQIAHNCDIGENALIVAQSGLAGGAVVGRGAIVMAQAGVGDHVRVGAGAFLGGRAGVTRDVAEGARVFGMPQQEGRQWHRIAAALGRLPQLLTRVRRLERRLGLRGGDEPGSGRDSDATR